MSTSPDARVLVTGGSGFIGTNLVDELLGRDVDVVSLDIRRPQVPAHEAVWMEGDILARDELLAAVDRLSPTSVVHLAARTDMDGQTVADYEANTLGTSNLINAMEKVGSVRRAVFASSQYVCGPGVEVVTDRTFAPHTVYGASKVEMERRIRAASPRFVWTIIRPTNVWGPWHPRYADEFWNVLRRGLYVHPGRDPVIRGYGYVGNVNAQILRALELDSAAVDRRVFYVGDPLIPLLEWVSAFSRGITGRHPRIVPRGLVRAIGRVGDVLTAVGLDFPLTSSRYRSMTEDYTPPMEPSLAVLGRGEVGLDAGVERTLQWLRDHRGWTC